mgnify:CR=1 FL=1
MAGAHDEALAGGQARRVLVPGGADTRIDPEPADRDGPGLVEDEDAADRYERTLRETLALDKPGEEGRLDFADFEIDRSTGTMSLRGTIGNEQGFLRDGLFVRVRLSQPPRTALALPESSVLIDMAGAYVYVVDGEGLVVRQGVETGVSLGGLTEILKGVDASSTVIVDGILRARPGAKVTAEIVALPEAMRTRIALLARRLERIDERLETTEGPHERTWSLDGLPLARLWVRDGVAFAAVHEQEAHPLDGDAALERLVERCVEEYLGRTPAGGEGPGEELGEHELRPQPRRGTLPLIP